MFVDVRTGVIIFVVWFTKIVLFRFVRFPPGILAVWFTKIVLFRIVRFAPGILAVWFIEIVLLGLLVVRCGVAVLVSSIRSPSSK